MQTTRRRRQEITRIVREAAVHSQEELLGLLDDRGFHVTQPTLSRDIRALGLAKTPLGWVLPGEIAAEAESSGFAPPATRVERFEQAVLEFVREVESSGQLVVARTPPAGAQPVARALDQAGLPGVVGTVAGDDTLFIATKRPRVAAELARRMMRLVEPRRRGAGR